MRTREEPATAPRPFPSRYVHLDAARQRFGHRVDRFGAFFWEGDPLADEVIASLSPLPRARREALIDAVLSRGADAVPEAPEALRALSLAVEDTPLWVDFERVDRGGRAFLRSGLLGGLVLGALSLVAGYCSPAGNKPLAFSGRLEDETPRRLAETSRFVQAVSLPGGMRPRADGFRYCVRVRLVHAAVRAMLQRSPRWNLHAWGLPINQADMSGTLLLFSFVVLDGLDKLGFATTPEEREDLLHLWRYAGFLLGVDEELRCTSEREARALWDLLSSTQAPPDDDSRALAHALIRSEERAAKGEPARRRARRSMRLGYALSRYLIGERYADWLGFPKTPMDLALPAFRRINTAVDKGWTALPGVPFATAEAGRRYWQFVVESSLKGAPATFHLPDRLRVE